MSVKLMSMAFQAKLPDTKVGDNNVAQSTLKIVLLALADHSNDEGKSIYPSIQRLENMTGLKDRTVQRAIDALESLSILGYVGKSEYQTNEYKIIPSVLAGYIGGDSSTQGGDLNDKKRVPESPKPSYKPSIEPERYDTIGAKIDECKIKLNPNSAFIVKAWREWFSDEIICRALELGAGKSINYTDRILCGWHENGVPETNQQKAKGEKRNDRINPKVDQKPISDDDKIALIAAIKAQRQREAASV